MIALVVAFCLQEQQTAFRSEKAEYFAAQLRCKEGEALLAADPRAAIEKFSEILNNGKIKKIECRLRIEERPSEYTEYYAFFPYQYRGQARLNLAGKSDRDAAERLLAGAIEDFQESLTRGLKSSEALLKDARGKLDTLKAVPPADGFRPRWQQLLAERKYASARAWLETGGKPLSDAQRKSFAEQADRECRAWLAGELADFRRSLATVKTQEDLRSMSDAQFQAAFALPVPDEITTADPAFEWARALLPRLKAVQSKKADGGSLIPAARESVKLVESGENLWFKALESVIYDCLRSTIAAAVDASRDAVQAERAGQRAQADRALASWKGFTGGDDPKSRELEKLFPGFPVDLAELPKLELDACFAAAAPETELEKLEKSLRALESRTGVSIESRRDLCARIVTVASLRALLAGRTEEDVAKELAAYGPKVGEAEKRFGPRVQKIFQLLLR